jgi:outer membrane biosynthesis protein TonB
MDLALQKKEEQKSKLVGYSVTTTIHVLLFILLWYSILHTPDPPLGEGGGGMELSMALGEPDMGGPSEIPVESPAPVTPIPENQPDPQEQISQEVEDVAVTAKKAEEQKKTEVKKPVEKKPVETPVEKPRVADERALFKKKTTNAADGGRGSGSTAGNEGRADGEPDGSPDGNGHGNGDGGSGGGSGGGNGTGIGSGNGDGMSYSLAGRSLSNRPEVIDNSKETGKVVVGIKVDRNGKVIEVQPGIKGTTNLTPVLLEKARQGALQARFSPKPDGPEEQYGTMTFIFRFKQ